MTGLRRRLNALEGGLREALPMCLVIARDGETEDEAVSRHIGAGECKPNDGHMIVMFADPPARSMAA